MMPTTGLFELRSIQVMGASGIAGYMDLDRGDRALMVVEMNHINLSIFRRP